MNATMTSTGRLAPQQLVGGAIYATLYALPMGLGWLWLTKLAGLHAFGDTGVPMVVAAGITWLGLFATFPFSTASMNVPGRLGRTFRILGNPTIPGSAK